MLLSQVLKKLGISSGFLSSNRSQVKKLLSLENQLKDIIYRGMQEKAKELPLIRQYLNKYCKTFERFRYFGHYDDNSERAISTLVGFIRVHKKVNEGIILAAFQFAILDYHDLIALNSAINSILEICPPCDDDILDCVEKEKIIAKKLVSTLHINLPKLIDKAVLRNAKARNIAKQMAVIIAQLVKEVSV